MTIKITINNYWKEQALAFIVAYFLETLSMYGVLWLADVSKFQDKVIKSNFSG